MKSQLIIEVESQRALSSLQKINGVNIISYSNIIPKNIQEIIDGIIEDFDFTKVHNVMKYMNWEWCSEGVPSIEKLKECVIELLERAYNGYFERGNGECYYLATGGFEASYMYDNNEDCFELKFVLESVDNY